MGTEKLTKAQIAYRKWYKANKAAFNKARAERYAADPAKREIAANKQREYRKTQPRKKSDGRQFRVIKKVKVEVFRIGAVAEMLGCNEQTIRGWERKNFIPKPTVQSAHRYYTKSQVNLLVEWFELATLVRWNRKEREVALPKKSAEIYAQWAGVKK